MSSSESESTASTPTWTPDALERLKRAPIFLRGMVKRLAEKKAMELGRVEITGELLDQFKQQMMGGMGGEAGMAEAADQMAKGRLPWTAEAKKRLETVPEFMRAMTQQIAEEVAREGGHMEVNVDLFEKEPMKPSRLSNGPKALKACCEIKLKTHLLSRLNL